MFKFLRRAVAKARGKKWAKTIGYSGVERRSGKERRQGKEKVVHATGGYPAFSLVEGTGTGRRLKVGVDARRSEDRRKNQA